MKKVALILNYVLIVLMIFLPFGVTVCSFSGYTFHLFNYSVCAVLTALCAISIVFFCTAIKEPAENDTIVIFYDVAMLLSPPLSLINALFYITRGNNLWVIASMLICTCCCLYLTIRYVKPRALKTLSLVLSAIMAPIVGFCALVIIWGTLMSSDTIIQSIASPNGTYYAEVIDNNQGALGGSTLVVIYENKCIHHLIFNISPKRQTIYNGRWGEFKNMKIHWKDENCLVINSVEYAIKGP